MAAEIPWSTAVTISMNIDSDGLRRKQ